MKKLILTLSIFSAFGLGLLVMNPSPVYAQGDETQQELIDEAQCQQGDNRKCVEQAGDPAATIECDEEASVDEQGCNIVSKYLNPFIKVLTVLVGVAVVIGIIVGGIQYAS